MDSERIEGVNQGPFGSLVRKLHGINNADNNALFSENGQAALRDVLALYRDAGANIGGAPTFRLTDLRARSRVDEDWEYSSETGLSLNPVTVERNKTAVSIARDVFGSDGFVAGLVSPITKTSGGHDDRWKSLRSNQVDWAYQRQLPQISVLQEAGVDAVWGEAFRYQGEAIALARAVRETRSHVLVVCFESNEGKFPDPEAGDGYCFAEMKADLKREAGSDVEVMIGVNCTGVSSVRRILDAGNKLDVVYPNTLDFGGVSVDVKTEFVRLAEKPNRSGDEEVRYQELIDELFTRDNDFEQVWRQCLETGVKVIGVCCGGTPELVKKARGVYDAIK